MMHFFSPCPTAKTELFNKRERKKKRCQEKSTNNDPLWSDKIQSQNLCWGVMKCVKVMAVTSRHVSLLYWWTGTIYLNFLWRESFSLARSSVFFGMNKYLRARVHHFETVLLFTVGNVARSWVFLSGAPPLPPLPDLLWIIHSLLWLIL